MSDYRIVCQYCGAVFTAYEWQPHGPDCVYEPHGGLKEDPPETLTCP